MLQMRVFQNSGLICTKESQSNTIRFPDDEPETIKLLMNYLYEGEYDPELVSVDINASNSVQIQDKDKPHTCFGNRDIACTNNEVCAHHTCGQDCSSNCRRFVCLDCVAVRESYRKPTVTGDASQLMTHVKMYGIADKYGVLGLKDLSQEKFRRACRSFWNDANFATAAHDAFLTTLDEDKGLRDIVSQIISDHMELLQKPEIEVLFVTFNGLAYGLLKEKQAQGLV